MTFSIRSNDQLIFQMCANHPVHIFSFMTTRFYTKYVHRFLVHMVPRIYHPTWHSSVFEAHILNIMSIHWHKLTERRKVQVLHFFRHSHSRQQNPGYTSSGRRKSTLFLSIVGNTKHASYNQFTDYCHFLPPGTPKLGGLKAITESTKKKKRKKKNKIRFSWCEFSFHVGLYDRTASCVCVAEGQKTPSMV